MDNISKIIEEITRRSFKVIKKVYASQREAKQENKENLPEIGSRILLPKYSEHRKPSEKDRISEQELRFIFVEQFNKECAKEDCDLYYSVETPTDKSYVFNEDNGGPKVVAPEEEGEGVSARIDLAIMAKDAGNFKRIALIEFKAHNPDVNDYRKDICKLINEEWEDNPDCLKYFIQVINVKNEQRTWNNIENKKITAIDDLKEKDKKENEYSIEYRCFNLNSMNLKQGIIKTNKLQFTGCESLSTEE